MQQIALDEALLARARALAEQEGYTTVEAFVADAVAERLRRSGRQRFLASALRRRERLLAAGTSEEEVLEDFERFRDELWRAHPRGEHEEE
jgi:hypothetical protein